MQNHFMTIVSAAMGAGGAAYSNSCQGSFLIPSITDCQAALNNINTGSTYTDKVQFSVGSCYVVYATNGAGAQPLSGGTIRDTAQDILNDCGGHRGSFGTNNCDNCHVTINYRRS